MPTENLLTPDHLRRVAWRPPAELSAESLADSLRELGAREWQVERVLSTVLEAFEHPEPLPVRKKGAPAEH